MSVSAATFTDQTKAAPCDNGDKPGKRKHPGDLWCNVIDVDVTCNSIFVFVFETQFLL